MNPDELRKAHRRVPFRPFVMALENGETYSVRHPEQLTIADVVVFWSDGRRKWSMFEPERVTAIRSANANGGSK